MEATVLKIACVHVHDAIISMYAIEQQFRISELRLRSIFFCYQISWYRYYTASTNCFDTHLNVD